MKFELLPILDLLIELYQKERSPQRFKEYLQLMIGENGDIDFPLPLINPMAKEHVLEQLIEIQSLEANKLMEEVIHKLNKEIELKEFPDFKVCLILADDWKGGWTNRFSTDYSNTFQPKGIFNRQFCTPILWTSETKSKDLIEKRTAETLLRTIYQSEHSWPETLADHIKQEAFVQQRLGIKPNTRAEEFAIIQEVYDEFKMSENPSMIMTFLYGDQAAESLGYSPIGAYDFMGFEVASALKL